MKFNKVGLRFKDIDNAAEFFTKKLDFSRHSVIETKAGKKIICLENNDIVLELFEAQDSADGRGHYKLLSFTVDDMEGAMADLKSKGVEFIEGPTKSSSLDGKYFYYSYFYGPESVKLGLFQKL